MIQSLVSTNIGLLTLTVTALLLIGSGVLIGMFFTPRPSTKNPIKS
ncbi:hypothetical protein IC229_05610 [Spirosoma sp. BT702]|uniref:Uncharacterized protein n=1 Tax=Spirosoma profusum TaxID=2771354 RepID=A0A926Y1H4_9BACT|nr:hypothetical protein [Spirosoma profusum]MBD2700101.1 hypothetical protein [Spirosoma profusum]